MRKLAALVAFITKTLNIVAAEQIQSDFDIEEYIPRGDYVFNANYNGVCSADVVYSAVINLERLRASISPQYILTLISLWLLDNDPKRYRNKIERGGSNEQVPLDPPTITTVIRDDHTVDFELTIPFREPLFVIEDPAGTLPFKGKQYRLANDAIANERFEQDYIMAR